MQNRGLMWRCNYLKTFRAKVLRREVIKINNFIFFIVFKRLFNKGNRKHFFRVPIEFIETLVEVWEKLKIA